MTLKKWGEGIPEYTPKDLVSKEELMAMAMNRVGEEIREKGYEKACF